MKRKIALFLALLMIFTSALGNGITAKAGGTEDDDYYYEDYGTLENVDLSAGFSSTTGYYPASLEYVLYNMKFTLDFNSGKSETLTHFYADADLQQEEYYGFLELMGTFFLKLYDENGEQVELNDVTVPIGTYEIRLIKGYDDTAVLWRDNIKILDPSGVVKEVGNNSASFAASDNNTFEEAWYQTPSDYEGDYTYSVDGLESTNSFESIWTFNDGVATQINDGIVNSKYSADTMFTQSYASGQTDTYLVIGETTAASNPSGSITWAKKKEIKSIEISPNTSYNMWDEDFYTVPLTIIYEDGTSETYHQWESGGFHYKYLGDDGRYWSSNYTGYSITTTNNDIIAMGMKDSGDNWVKPYSEDYWLPGETNWIAYVTDSKTYDSNTTATVTSSATVTVAAPEITTFDLADKIPKNFTVTKGNAVFYTCKATEAKQIQITGNSDLDFFVYERELDSGNPWSICIISGGSSTEDLSANMEYLFRFETDSIVQGSIGAYVKGSASSAAVDVTTVDIADANVWKNLPITVSFIDEEGDSVGAQTISNWTLGTTLSAKTKYNETLQCALYKDGAKVSIATMGSGLSEEELYKILKEYGLDPDSMSAEELAAWSYEIAGRYDTTYTNAALAAGTYTLKVYKGSVSSDNEIGSKSITVKNSSITAPAKVTAKVAMSAATKAKVSWNASENADGYLVYRATSKTGTYTQVADVNADTLSYTNTGLTYGKTYYYKVVAYCKNGSAKLCADNSNIVSVKLALGKTTISSASNISSGVQIKWAKVTGATGYYVYRKTGSGSYSKIKTISSASTVTYTDKAAKNGTKYTYKVVAYYGKNTGSYNTKTIVRLTRPTISSAKNSSSKAIAVKWNKNTKATGYQVKYVTGSTTKTVTVSKNSTVSYTIKKLTKGKTYKVYVRSYKTVSGTKHYSAWSGAKSVKVSK